MNYVTAHHVLSILTAQADRFDSHTVEREFRSKHPELFVAEFSHFASSTDPLKAFSMRFGRWLLDTFPHVIRPTQKVKSNNLRERLSGNQEWQLIHQ
ncbi:hypothetical protein [Verrucomicrobium spinosum]|uniref:hypothetical protein n=1 Tax=Verrucomicrobium spinosum TaxID=2736 RepID=UPI0012F6F7DA|nr:hypothetical protein [Verrucomicrobium spinosum]